MTWINLSIAYSRNWIRNRRNQEQLAVVSQKFMPEASSRPHWPKSQKMENKRRLSSLSFRLSWWSTLAKRWRLTLWITESRWANKRFATSASKWFKYLRNYTESAKCTMTWSLTIFFSATRMPSGISHWKTCHLLTSASAPTSTMTRESIYKTKPMKNSWETSPFPAKTQWTSWK